MKITQVKKNLIFDKKRLYLDFTASGLLHQGIEKKIYKIAKTYSNLHSEIGINIQPTTKYYNQARESFKKTLEISDDFYIFPTGTGSTGAIKKFQEIMGLYIPPATKNRVKITSSKKVLVIVGPFEHHSNEISYREGLCDVLRIPADKETGAIDLKKLKKVLEENKKREIIGAFSVASNVTGIFNPIEKIYKIIKKYKGIVVLDGAASSAHMNINSKYYDALFLSPHKLIGGPGSCGLLILRKNLYDNSLSPTFAGGGIVYYVSKKEKIYLENPEIREDVGTPGIFQFIRASLVYELRNDIGLEFIKRQEKELNDYFIEKFNKINNGILYESEKKNRLGIFSFNIKNINPYKITEILSKKFKIETRAGCSCAGPYGHDLLSLKDGFYKYKDLSELGWIRIGFIYIHTKKDIDYFFISLKKTIVILNKKKC